VCAFLLIRYKANLKGGVRGLEFYVVTEYAWSALPSLLLSRAIEFCIMLVLDCFLSFLEMCSQ